MAINKILCGDSLEVLKDFEDNYFDSVVTDSPYGLAFMGKKWDYDVPEVDLWKEVYRVLKPGGHLLSFAGSRTYHRMAVNIEDAGFEIRDMLGWLYGSGFPKSYNIAKGIEGKLKHGSANWNDWNKLDGELVESKIGFSKLQKKQGYRNKDYSDKKHIQNVKFHTEEAKQWEGWGTALKPAHEPIVMARKPFNTSVAENVLTHGTGGINIDECRVGTESIGRFPANIIHDGSEEVLEVFEESSRFFYCAKASKAERNMGLDHYEEKPMGMSNRAKHRSTLDDSHDIGLNRVINRKNYHPTVKPIKLMEYLVRLVTPKEGIVLEPFAGSGTTLIACKQQGFQFVGIEKEQEYCDIAEARLKSVQVQGELF